VIENLSTDIELWPVAADRDGIWLVSGIEPWRSRMPVPADSSPHGEADLMLARISTSVRLLHSTSWRAEPYRVVLSYIVVLDAPAEPGAVRLRWPDAQPIDPGALLGTVGNATSWTGSESPQPRHLDVLLHAVRHLAFLVVTDPGVAETLPPIWADHLISVTPALAGMYEPTKD
jgi:hypothetical protein